MIHSNLQILFYLVVHIHNNLAKFSRNLYDIIDRLSIIADKRDFEAKH